MAEIKQAERFEGTWNGEEVHPKRVWSGHRFTDEECEKLLRGEEIVIEAVSGAGKAYKCRGMLDKQSYGGNPFVGFKRTGFVNDGPTSWCKYDFTDEEKKDLLDGKHVTGNMFVGQSGKRFKAEIRWDKEQCKICVVEFLKS